MGNYSVSLDSGSISNYNARHDDVNSEVVVFYADNLGPGTHQVTFINNPSNEGAIASSFLVEKAVVTLVSKSASHHSKYVPHQGQYLLKVADAFSKLAWAR